MRKPECCAGLWFAPRLWFHQPRADACAFAIFWTCSNPVLINLQFSFEMCAVGPKKTQFPGADTAISGRRYYNPSQGRFFGRDPIEEKGGLHLYAFCTNNPINHWDMLGNSARPGEVEYSFYSGDNGDFQADWDDDDWARYGDLKTSAGIASAYDYNLGWFIQQAGYTNDFSSVMSNQAIASAQEAANRIIAEVEAEALYASALANALAGATGTLQANKGRMPTRAPTVAELEAALTARVTAAGKGGKNDPVAYARARAELEAFRTANGIRPPGSSAGLTITAANLTNNPKHNPNSSSPQPPNVVELYRSSIPDSSGVRWSVDNNGVIHRFSAPSNGQTHWNGSTAGSRPIQSQNIPNEILIQLKPGG